MTRKNQYFHFKKFSIDHSDAEMKVGTDGVLLGAWLTVRNPIRVLDIGTGSGLIALMLAQRTGNQTNIDAVDMAEKDCGVAIRNVQDSPWQEKVKVYCSRIQDYQSSEKYDLIVSNPPFFINSYKPPAGRREHVRHTTELSFDDLIESVDRLLSDDGFFNVILPCAEAIHFRELALARKLYCSRISGFRPRKTKPLERTLMEFSRKESSATEEEILFLDESNDFSEQYKVLTRDFYLKFE